MNPPANMLLIILVASVASSLVASGAGACKPHERDALLGFKREIISDPAGLLSSWQESNKDCCRWRGVHCRNHTGHVLKLQLRNPAANGDISNHIYYYAYHNLPMTKPMVGQISHSLLSLEHLEFLDLSWNNLTDGSSGRIPMFLGSLKNLKYLNLSGIPFSGQVPPYLGNLSNLQYLDLSFTGSSYSEDISWLQHLQVLQHLSLSQVYLAALTDWPDVVNMIPSLRVLDLHNCSLTSANQWLPHLNLTSLEKLDLSENYFEHPISSAWFWNITHIKHLNLRETALYGLIPRALQEMTSLQFLAISPPYDENKHNVTLDTSLRNHCNLECLELRGNLSYSDIAELFESLPHCSYNKLRELDLSGNYISGVLPTQIRQLTSLERLDLSGNKISGVLPNWMGQLTSLKDLDLSYNEINGLVPKWLVELTRLEYLSLSANNLTGVLPNMTGQQTRLAIIHLSHNSISGILPNWIWKCTSLTDIYLSGNNITGPLPQFVGNLSSLMYLDLSFNQLSGPLPIEIGMLSNLRELYLNDNNLDGTITEEHFATLKMLRWIELTNNSLKIVIASEWQPPFILSHADFRSCQMGPQFPSWFKWMVDIDFLDISNTGINDRLPDWFCSTFSKATFLIISNNQVHGGLPADMEQMSLEYLDLGSNNLTGPIPPMPITLVHLDLSTNMLSGPLL